MTSSHGLRGRSRLQACRGVLHTTIDDDHRRQRPLLVCPPTLCVGGPVINVFSRQPKLTVLLKTLQQLVIKYNSCHLACNQPWFTNCKPTAN